jgi:hypothetical protein
MGVIDAKTGPYLVPFFASVPACGPRTLNTPAMTAMRLLAAILVGLGLSSCSIHVRGPRNLAVVGAGVVVGRTTGAELRAQLGKPIVGVARDGRTIMSWISGKADIKAVTLVPIVGAIVDSNAANLVMLGVETDASSVVRRKVFHESTSAIRQSWTKTQLGVQRADVGDMAALAQLGSGAALVNKLGPPTTKHISFEGERWYWMGVKRSFADDLSVVVAYFDLKGRLVRVERVK